MFDLMSFTKIAVKFLNDFRNLSISTKKGNLYEHCRHHSAEHQMENFYFQDWIIAGTHSCTMYLLLDQSAAICHLLQFHDRPATDVIFATNGLRADVSSAYHRCGSIRGIYYRHC